VAQLTSAFDHNKVGTADMFDFPVLGVKET
jgi:hypothetical protein